jgi:imidazole glycerol-phosphate synthase subunit HisF
MFRPRVIPCLLLQNNELVKTIKFKKPTYVGDSINAVRIFNESHADELIFLDISATQENRIPSLELISKLSDECFMPFSVGGGIRKLKDVKRIIQSGAEKIILNTYAIENPDFINEVANSVGSQSVVVSIDVKKKLWGGYEVLTHSGRKKTGLNPVDFAQLATQKGAGEIFVNSIDRDGTMIGYDTELVKNISEAVTIPVIACGGSGSFSDLEELNIKSEVSALSAGSMFVFHGKHRAVLVNYPTQKQLMKLIY